MSGLAPSALAATISGEIDALDVLEADVELSEFVLAVDWAVSGPDGVRQLLPVQQCHTAALGAACALASLLC
jgi:hypothetical protein